MTEQDKENSIQTQVSKQPEKKKQQLRPVFFDACDRLSFHVIGSVEFMHDFAIILSGYMEYHNWRYLLCTFQHLVFNKAISPALMIAGNTPHVMDNIFFNDLPGEYNAGRVHGMTEREWFLCRSMYTGDFLLFFYSLQMNQLEHCRVPTAEGGYQSFLDCIMYDPSISNFFYAALDWYVPEGRAVVREIVLSALSRAAIACVEDKRLLALARTYMKVDFVIEKMNNPTRHLVMEKHLPAALYRHFPFLDSRVITTLIVKGVQNTQRKQKEKLEEDREKMAAAANT